MLLYATYNSKNMLHLVIDNMSHKHDNCTALYNSGCQPVVRGLLVVHGECYFIQIMVHFFYKFILLVRHINNYTFSSV